jgi:hypothetical protein
MAEDLSHLGAAAPPPDLATEEEEAANRTDDEKLEDAGLPTQAEAQAESRLAVVTDIITDDMKTDLAGRESPDTDEEKAGAA